MKIINQSNGFIIADNVKLANTFSTRLIGLLNRKSINRKEALIIFNCNSIHMFFMRFSIDVIFIDINQNVVGLVKKIKPFQLSSIYWKAVRAIELPAGLIDESKTSLGDQIKILPE